MSESFYNNQNKYVSVSSTFHLCVILYITVHEEYLIERTKNICKGGVDVIIDYSSSPRTVQRSMKVLGDDGILVVGGNARYEVSFCLHSLARKQQTIIGVSKGTRNQLEELVDMVASGKVCNCTY